MHTVEKSKCPHCNNILYPTLRKKTKCKICRKFIFARIRPYDKKRVLMTSQEVDEWEKVIRYQYFEDKITRKAAAYLVTLSQDSPWYIVNRAWGIIGSKMSPRWDYDRKFRNYDEAEDCFKLATNWRINKYGREYKLRKEWKARRKLFVTLKKILWKMVFLNIGWMKDYKGLKKRDSIIGGGEFVRKYKYGHEIYNFLPFDGYMYGYVQPTHTISIDRIGANNEDEFINEVLVVWVSKSPSGGTEIIGWYKNATVYRKHQPAPKGSNRKYKGHELGYFVKAKAKDCVLLPMNKRIFRIPRGKTGMGQSNVWYADKILHASFKQKVSDFINTGKIPEEYKSSKTKNGKPWQPDLYKRQKIEKIAIGITTKHFRKLEYVIDSVEKDNMGWDLEATMGDQKLRLEVKGLSQEDLLIELTPKEYEKMRKYIDSYRICVVTKSLSRKPLLRIFSFSPENRRWEDDKGFYLKIAKIVSARMTL